MTIKKIEFPKEVEARLKAKIKQSISVEYFNGSRVDVDKFNLEIVEPHKILFKKGNNIIIVYITENERANNGRYNFFINSICDEARHSLNSLINLINANLI